MKIIVPIRPKNFDEFCLFEKKINHRADLVEIWLDGIANLDDFLVKLNTHKTEFPFLGVCKTKEENGVFTGSPEKKVSLLLQFLNAKDDFIDLDVWRNDAALIQQIPVKNLVLSFHDFETVPSDLESVFEKMKPFRPALYKLAVTPQTKADLDRFLTFAETKKDFSIIFTTMGKWGTEGREKLKNISFAGFYALDEKSKTASGQLCLDDL